jgi:general secretion pathway protein A
MYLNHFNLEKKPFDITPDPAFFWLGEKHKEGWASLEYGILENKGFLLLTGDIGTGKTALINLLIKSTQVKSIIANIPDPDLEILDLFNFLSEEFQMNKTFDSKGEFLIEFKNFLYEVYRSDGKVLLIIDEAQRLNYELLGQIRTLSNIERAEGKLINIFFVGQTEFIDILREERNEAVRKRITVSYHLDPLSSSETEQYIVHRLKVAGVTRTIFTADAIRQIYSFARGYPRIINIVCDHALLTGYSKELDTIDQDIILECEKDLSILSDEQQPKNQERIPDPIPAAHDIQESYNFQREYNFIQTTEKKQSNKRIGIVAALILLSILTGYLIFHFQLTSTAQVGKKEIVQSKSGENLETKVLKKEIATKSVVAESQIGKTTSEEKTTAPSVIKESYASENIQPVYDPLPQNKPASFKDHKFVVHFKHKSNQIAHHELKTLDQVVKLSAYNPTTEIVIDGYTDSMGDYIYNKNLSKIRADRVKSYLISRGIPTTKITTFGRGPDDPIQSNETYEGRNKNRRVEIRVKTKSPE